MTDRRSQFLVLTRATVLFALIAGTNHGVGQRLDYLLTMQRYLGLAAYIGVWVATLLALAAVGLTTSRVGRLVWIVPLALSTLVADVYYDLTQLRFNIDTAEAFWQMRFWAKDAVETFGFRMWAPGVRALGLALVLALPPRMPAFGWRTLVLLPLLPIFLCTSVLYRTGGYGVEGLPVQFSTLSLGTLLVAYPLPPTEREPVHLARVRAQAIRKIVLVVDESVRADFVDLADPSGVTPYLAHIRSAIVNYGVASSASNCSQPGNAILRMGANPRTLGVGGTNIMGNPGLWKYARAAAYQTVFLDAQAKNGVLINYMTPQEKKLLDRFIQVSMPAAYENDYAAARELRALLQEPTPTFVYVNKRGAHYPYDWSYPAEAARFRPTQGVGAPIVNRKALLNSYRNAIAWSVDGFFRALVDGLDLHDSLIVYTSDHGQNLLEDGDPVTHCRRTASVREAAVPLFVITGDEALHARFARAASRNRDRTSHFQIFPTLLEIMGFDPKDVRQTYYLTLFDDIQEPLGYTSGAVFGRFGIPPAWHPFQKEERGRFHSGISDTANRPSAPSAVPSATPGDQRS